MRAAARPAENGIALVRRYCHPPGFPLGAGVRARLDRSSVLGVQHEHTEHIAAPADRVYAAISDVANLPRFVPQLTGARAVAGDRVEVDARYHGREQHGEASFSADPRLRRIDWGTPSGYHGWMQVAADGDGSRLTLFLNTQHGSEREHDVSATLDAIRMLVEAQV
jgi:uncharacterized protein YndB with AHSA1/START domain